MAELIQEKLSIEPAIVQGRLGEFTVTLDGRIVVKKGWFGFPNDERILNAIRTALAQCA